MVGGLPQCEKLILTCWRLFIIDGVISLPIAIAGFFVLPDVPEISRAWYFSKAVSVLIDLLFGPIADVRRGIGIRKEKSAARGSSAARPLHQGEGQEDLDFMAHLRPQSPLRVSNILSSRFERTDKPRCFNNGVSGAVPVFAQFLKDSKHPKYTVSQINTYPTGTSAVQVVSTLIYAWFSDSVLSGRRWPPIVFGGIINIICYVSLAIWTIPTGWKWACYYIMGCGYGLSGLIMA